MKCTMTMSLSNLETIMTAKGSLRQQIKTKLNRLTQTEKDFQSVVVVNKVLSSEIFKECQNVSVYLPMKNEVNTLPILKSIFKNGKKCFIPHYQKDDMIMLNLKSWDDYEKLPINSWGIKQPSHFDASKDAISEGGLDLILMPGLAFTQDGKRLGRGKGYYDKYLKKCEDFGQKPKTIALLFKEQLVEDIPISQNDILVDYVFYPTDKDYASVQAEYSSS